MAANLRGLTEEEADRAISQTLVGRLAPFAGLRHRRARSQEGLAEAFRDAGLRRCHGHNGERRRSGKLEKLAGTAPRLLG